MILNKTIVNYKLVDLVELYKFDTQFIFFYMKKIWILIMI